MFCEVEKRIIFSIEQLTHQWTLRVRPVEWSSPAGQWCSRGPCASTSSVLGKFSSREWPTGKVSRSSWWRHAGIDRQHSFWRCHQQNRPGDRRQSRWGLLYIQDTSVEFHFSFIVIYWVHHIASLSIFSPYSVKSIISIKGGEANFSFRDFKPDFLHQYLLKS